MLSKDLYLSLVYFLDVRDEIKLSLLSKDIRNKYLSYSKLIYDCKSIDDSRFKRTKEQFVAVLFYYCKLISVSHPIETRIESAIDLFTYITEKANPILFEEILGFKFSMKNKLIEFYKTPEIKDHVIGWYSKLFDGDIEEEPNILEFIAEK